MSTCATCGTHLKRVDGVCPTCMARSITSFLGSSRTSLADDVEVPGYELHEVIGRGGMGIVYRATRLEDDVVVAIKLLPQHLADREDVADRFAREAQALAALNHEHVLRVLDSGLTLEGRLFLVTEFAVGSDLAKLLQQGPLSVDEAVAKFSEVLSAIAEAHRQGIAHRDIKPANILLGENNTVRVGDFSLAKLLREGAAPQLTLTQSADVFGTPYYIAPEVRRGAGTVDERADIFSLGVLLHEMLTGRLPIGNYEPASKLVKVPRAVDQLVARCLQEAPAKRPQSVAILQQELNAALSPRRWAWVMIGVAVLALIVWWRQPPPAASKQPETATREQPWNNSLGMRFVPAAGSKVLFSVWETRRRDFGVYASSPSVRGENQQDRWRRPLGAVTPNDPVTPVSYAQSVHFCEWLSSKEHDEGTLPLKARYRLPTDIEWSLAAGLQDDTGSTPEERGRSPIPLGHAQYAWGFTWPPPGTGLPANFAGQEVSADGLRHRDAWKFTAPVGTFKASALGLYDISGNVAEWCQSVWNTQSGDYVLRGGSWNDSAPESLRLDYRAHGPANLAITGAGFRVVLEP